MKALALLLLPTIVAAHEHGRIGAVAPVGIPSLAPSAISLSIPQVPILGFDPSRFDVDQWARWRSERLRDQKAFLERERPEFSDDDKARLKALVEAAMKDVDETDARLAAAADKAKATLLVESAQGRRTAQSAAEARARIDKLLSVQRCLVHGNLARAFLRETARSLNEDPWSVLQGDEYEPKLSRPEYVGLLQHYALDTRALGADADLAAPTDLPDEAFRQGDH